MKGSVRSNFASSSAFFADGVEAIVVSVHEATWNLCCNTPCIASICIHNALILNKIKTVVSSPSFTTLTMTVFEINAVLITSSKVELRRNLIISRQDHNALARNYQIRWGTSEPTKRLATNSALHQ